MSNRGGRGGQGRDGGKVQEIVIRGGPVDLRQLFGDTSMRKNERGRAVASTNRPMRAKFIDSLDYFGAYRGIREKQYTRVTYEVLRRMARSCEPMAAIIQLRCNQAGNYAKLPEYESDAGFKITTRDPKQKIRRAESKEIKRLEDLFLHTGMKINPDREDNFDAFIRKIVRDSLILDAYAFEIVPGLQPRKFPVSEFYAVDAGTIRLANEDRYQPEIYEEDSGRIAYIQQIDGRIVAEFRRDQLAYGIRNPTTEVKSNGYGVSELEIAINLITSILFGMQYNTNYFKNNSTPRGILNLVGNYTSEDLEAFKRQWRAQMEGVTNAWRTPIMASEDGQGLSFVPLDQKGNRDMEYHLWLDFLVNFLCAIYLVNPSELGIKGYNPHGASLNEGSKDKDIEAGEDKGLVPLLSNIGNTLNTKVVQRINPDFRLQWTGIRQDDKKQKSVYYQSLMAAGIMTANEVRTQGFDLPEIPEKWANAPANPTLFSAWHQEVLRVPTPAPKPDEQPGEAEPPKPGLPDGSPGGPHEDVRKGLPDNVGIL